MNIQLPALLEPMFVLRVLTSAFLAIVFLQSGIDKIIDWKGNLSWLTGHFANSPLRNIVPFMLLKITVLEVLAGALSAIGVIMLLVSKQPLFALLGAELSAITILLLFFGQRIAKDYAGAATLVGYFLVALFGILIIS